MSLPSVQSDNNRSEIGRFPNGWFHRLKLNGSGPFWFTLGTIASFWGFVLKDVLSMLNTLVYSVGMNSICSTIIVSLLAAGTLGLGAFAVWLWSRMQ